MKFLLALWLAAGVFVNSPPFFLFLFFDAASVRGLFHPSWLLCVYQRMFHSENKTLMREGVFHLLQLQVLQQPGFALAFSQVRERTIPSECVRLALV